jgi:hypothetical protein
MEVCIDAIASWRAVMTKKSEPGLQRQTEDTEVT